MATQNIHVFYACGTAVQILYTTDKYNGHNGRNLYQASITLKAIPLVPADRVFLPPLHIKLGLMKNFVKALPKNGEGFKYLSHKFPSVSDAKMKAGVLVGPQIRELPSDTGFTETLNTS